MGYDPDFALTMLGLMLAEDYSGAVGKEVRIGAGWTHNLSRRADGYSDMISPSRHEVQKQRWSILIRLIRLWVIASLESGPLPLSQPLHSSGLYKSLFPVCRAEDHIRKLLQDSI